MIYRKFSNVLLLLILSFGISGCLKVNTGTNTKEIPDAGLYVSLDNGTKWEQRTSVLSTGGAVTNFSKDSVSVIALDPSDPETIYFGTINQGLLYSLDRGLSWQLVYDLGPGTINSIAIDPKDKCKVYVSMKNKLSKTDDCARTWKTVFTDPVENVTINSVVVDHFSSDNIYIALSRGDLVKSANGGGSWQTLYRFNNKYKSLTIDSNDSRRMYSDIDRLGLQMSDDIGKTWTSLNQFFIDNKIEGSIVDLELIKDQPNLLFAATELGILKSTDRGKKWELLKLLPPKANAAITGMTVNPKNVNEIYYITSNTFYRSVDGGVNWSPRPIPSTKKARTLTIDTALPEVLYMGMSL